MNDLQSLTWIFTLLGISDKTHRRDVNASGPQSESSNTTFRRAQAAGATTKVTRQELKISRSGCFSTSASQRLLSIWILVNCCLERKRGERWKKKKQRYFPPSPPTPPTNRAYKGAVEHDSLRLEGDNLAILPSKSPQTTFALCTIVCTAMREDKCGTSEPLTRWIWCASGRPQTRHGHCIRRVMLLMCATCHKRSCSRRPPLHERV